MLAGPGPILRGYCFLPDGTEESTITLLLQGVDGLVGESSSGLLEVVEASIEVDEAELEVQGGRQRLKNLTAGLYHKKEPQSANWSCVKSRELPTGITSRPIPSPGMRPI